MGIYYLDVNGDYFELDSTNEVNISFPGRATDFPLEDGESASDHYINENTRVTFSGVISDVKTAVTASGPRVKSTDGYIKGLLRAKANKTPFTVFYANKLDPIDNCVFESLEVSQDSVKGTSGEVSAYKITFTAKQIRFGEAATFATVAVPASVVEDSMADKTSSSGSTQTLSDSEEELTRIQAIENEQEKLRRLQDGVEVRP